MDSIADLEDKLHTCNNEGVKNDIQYYSTKNLKALIKIVNDEIKRRNTIMKKG